MVQTGGGKGLIVAVERIVEHGSLLRGALARAKGRRRPFLPPPCGGGALRRTGGRRRGRGRRPPRSCCFTDLFLDFVRRGEASCAEQKGGRRFGFCRSRHDGAGILAQHREPRLAICRSIVDMGGGEAKIRGKQDGWKLGTEIKTEERRVENECVSK